MSILGCELPTRCITKPPVAAAAICGKQMVQLNKPSTVPMRELPSNALVTKVNGMGSIEKKKEKNNSKNSDDEVIKFKVNNIN